MKVLLIIPCYNEKDSIIEVVKNIKEKFPRYDYIVINDGSTDNTGELLTENNINHIEHKINCGLATAFRTGIVYAESGGVHYDAVCQFDADGQHLPDYIEDMIAAMEEENLDIVIGSRFLKAVEKESMLKKIGRKFISAIIFILTGTKLSDPTSGMRLYKDTIWKLFLKDESLAPEPDTLVYFLRKKYRVQEVAVKMNERVAGESYLTATKSIKYMIHVVSSMLFIQWWRK